MSSAAGITATPSSISRNVLHDIAHDLRQPLSAIESIAYYLALVVPHDDAKIQSQLTRLQELVEQSDWILSNGLHLAEPAAIAPELIDFEELLTEGISSRGWLPSQSPRLELAGNLPPKRIDPGLGRALIGNLLILFRQLATDSHPAIVRTFAAFCGSSSAGIAIEFETAEPGYRSESALGPGGNLSLASARRIAEAHGGSIECVVDPIAGIRVRVVLP